MRLITLISVIALGVKSLRKAIGKPVFPKGSWDRVMPYKTP